MAEKKVGKTHWPSYARMLKREANQSLREDLRFDSLLEKARMIEDPYYESQALSWIARRMAAGGMAADGVFSESIQTAKMVEQEWRRAELLISISSEMFKAGAEDFGGLMDAVWGMRGEEHRTATYQTIHTKMRRAGLEPPATPQGRTGSRTPNKTGAKNTPKKMLGEGMEKMSIGLYNTYKGASLQTPHIRAVARAAPLCHAFNLNLVLFSFPTQNIEDIVEAAERETGIGEGGRYLRTLHSSGRVFLMGQPDHHIIPGVGEIVATTSNPDEDKRVDLKSLINKGGKICFLMGLGSEGLPKKLLDLTRRHLELTGRAIPLETCTAMGVLAAEINLL